MSAPADQCGAGQRAEFRITATWLDGAPLQQVLGMLSEAGHQAYLVGGCVRNAALGLPVADIDIATDALPGRVLELAAQAGLRAVATGLEHGTVTVIAGAGIPHEITTFRRDVQTDGRHATVAFSRLIGEDAARRDFTMNALYARADGRVIDPLGEGLADLRRGCVRFVGVPEQRIREDYLRILRFFRFTAIYGDPAQGLEAEGLAACAALHEGLSGLSKERVGQEMRKLLAARDPAPALAAMQAAGILADVLAGADAAPVALLVHFEAEAGIAPDPLRRLAVLGGIDAADALRLSRAEARRLGQLRAAALSGRGAAVLGYRLGTAGGTDAGLVQAALSGLAPAATWRADIALGAAQRFPLAAADLPAALEGPAIGATLRRLEADWIDSGFALTRDELMVMAAPRQGKEDE